MFFPYSTDAPIYYWPFSTVAVIAVNVLVFAVTLTHPEMMSDLLLDHGDGLHPIQWVTSNFIHGGFLHLIGNMVMLWSFGLVVEGKLGWWKTLVVYSAIGIGECAVEQILCLGSPDFGSFGASSIVYGVMAMSLIWAPKNDMHCFVVFSFHVSEFDMSVLSLVGISLVLEIVMVFLTGFTMTSAAMHMLGAVIGFGISIGMLKAGMVDCENWDAFSILSGRHSMTEEERWQRDAKAKTPKISETPEQRREAAREEIRRVLASGQPELAAKAHERMAREFADWQLPENDLLGLIRALHEKRLWAASTPLMTEYISQHPEKSNLVRLKLAQILLIEENRPANALKVMTSIDETSLDARQKAILETLRAKAADLREDDPYEFAEDSA